MTGPIDDGRLLAALARLAELLGRIGEARAGAVAALPALHDRDPEAFWQALNANAWWAGAGSLAAATLADNPGLPEVLWGQEVREFRELLVEIGEALMSRGGENPGIASWVLAFRNWNASGV
jgi:hypothetical protein